MYTRTTGIIAGCALVLCSCPASAWQINYSLEMALGYSDNINQSETAPKSETLLIPRVNFDASEEGEALRAHAVGQVEYRDYLRGVYGNEVRGQLSGVATWIILPKRLSFDFEDYAAVQPVNILAANTPANQQQTNVFTLGPTFNFRLWQTLNGLAELRFTSSTASETKEFNSTRTMGAIRAVKELSPLDTLSANLEGQKVHFTDRSGGPDYELVEGYGRYTSKLTQLDLDFTAGYSRVHFPDASDHSALIGRGLVTWRATPNNTFAGSFQRRFADASQDIILDDPAMIVANALGTGVVVGSTAVTSEVYLEKRIQASYAFQSERYHLRVDPYYRNLDYLVDPTLDQQAHGVVGGISYRPRPLWTLAFDAAEETRTFNSIARRDEDWRLDLSFTDQFARQWSVRLDLIRNERNSDAVGQSYRENLAFATLIFKR